MITFVEQSFNVMEIVETKDKIIDQCFQLLLTKGYDGVSISDIQKATGISRGLLYHYFGSKEALFLQVIKQKSLSLFHIDFELIRNYSIEEMSDYIVGNYQRFITKTLNGISIINYDFLFYRAMQESKELAVLYDQVRTNELNGWKIVLENASKRGELRDHSSSDKLSDLFVYTTDGVWLQAVTPSSGIDLIESLKETFETLCSIIRK